MSASVGVIAPQIFGDLPILVVGDGSDEGIDEAEAKEASPHGFWRYGGGTGTLVRRTALEGAGTEGGR